MTLAVQQIPDTARCDGCGYRAFALATVNGTDLHFCGSHFTRHEAALREVASRVVDERHRRPK